MTAPTDASSAPSRAREWMAECERYLAARTGRYQWRRTRYQHAARRLVAGGLSDQDTLVDVGAGWTELDYYLRRELDWRGRYVPVDGAIDGTDLNHWTPPRPASWYVALELVEHLHDPARIVGAMARAATKGVVISTPNADTVDVRAMDPTHRSPVTPALLCNWGMEVEVCCLYGQPADGLIAWRYHPQPATPTPPTTGRTDKEPTCSQTASAT